MVQVGMEYMEDIVLIPGICCMILELDSFGTTLCAVRLAEARLEVDIHLKNILLRLEKMYDSSFHRPCP